MACRHTPTNNDEELWPLVAPGSRIDRWSAMFVPPFDERIYRAVEQRVFKTLFDESRSA